MVFLAMVRQRSHSVWMQQAIAAASAAGVAGDVPVGAVIVSPQDTLLAIAGNRRERDYDPTAHAEILALRQAGQSLGQWRLTGCRLYVTLEPCPMCASAIAQARIAQIVYGADDPKSGALRSVLNLPDSPASFHHLDVIGGILEEPCRHVLETWFRHHRQEWRQSSSTSSSSK
jgi:tRNA(adenine34) deaminase